MPKSPNLTPSKPRLPVTVRPIEDDTLLADIRAVAHLKRTTPKALVAEIIRTHLGPRFAPQVAT